MSISPLVPTPRLGRAFRRIPTPARPTLSHPDEVWDRALSNDEDLQMHGDGRTWALPVRSWIAEADAVDHEVVAECHGPTLDVGCGPGRFTAALDARGLPSLGLDTSAVAIALTRARGSMALHRSVWRKLPGEGKWATTVLLDGNVGIGGNPAALLRRMHELTEAGGACLVEAMPAGECWTGPVHLTDARGAASCTFPWARVDGDTIAAVAETTGWTVRARWTTGGRPFLRLRSR